MLELGGSTDTVVSAEPTSLAVIRTAQCTWARTPLAERLQVVRRLRGKIAANAKQLLDRLPRDLKRSRADSLSAEVIPLAEACRFLELEAKRILAPRKVSTAGRPIWLRGVGVEVRREPFGVVLLIGPANYPLFLTGVQALEALVAGNAAVIKPGRGGAPVTSKLLALAAEAGLPSGLLTVLDERVPSATAMIDAGVDKVFLTGSVDSGRAVLRRVSEQILPAVVELSGYDAVFVQATANLARAVEAVVFGLQFNGGNTCIAPRRVFVSAAVAGEFKRRLSERLELSSISIFTVDSDADALELAAQCPYALGATVFGEEREARALAEKIRAGVVVINDMIVPTADPRVPFGGRGMSGFGTTRGAEGLLEMTTLKAVVVQRAKRLRHLEEPPANAAELFLAYLSAKHSSGARDRWRGWGQLLKAIAGTRKAAG